MKICYNVGERRYINITISTNSDLATANAIRYRGYYYDDETGWYYLNARYYSPEWRRFISPDDTAYLDPENVNGLNLYCYCGNDPINFVDPSGHLPFFVITALIGAVIGLGITAAVDYIPDQEFNLHWGWYVFGGVVGAAIGAGIGMAISYATTGSAFSSTTQVFNSIFRSVSLYRTVGVDEYVDLRRSQMFRSGPNSMEGKFFAKTRKGAQTWAKKWGQSHYVKIRVSKSTLKHSSVEFIKHLDAIDDAYYFADLDLINTAINGFWLT